MMDEVVVQGYVPLAWKPNHNVEGQWGCTGGNDGEKVSIGKHRHTNSNYF